ncbi:MAG: hypothetical protein CMO34_00040 [Verrucomicrobia bacterium]|mgnify:FL=1|nr:hypothetical protein [Verrucomicrobiota bacterium]
MSNKIKSQFLITSGVFLIVQIVLAIIAWTSSNSYLDAKSWSRWDSYHYISISTQGYGTFPCSNIEESTYDKDEICGNTAWFPGFALCIRGLNELYNAPYLWGALLSKFFHYWCLFLIVRIMNISTLNKESVIDMLIPAFSFGFIYYYAVFPMSLVLLSVFIAFYAFLKQQWWLLLPSTFVAAISYPTGPLLAHVLALTILLSYKNKGLKWRIKHAFIPLFGGGLGLLSAFFLIHIEAGSWEAFFDVQSKYRTSASHNTLMNMLGVFEGLAIKRGFRNLIQIQSIIVIIGYFFLSWQFFKKKWHQNQLYLLTYIYVSFYFLFIWSVGGNLSMYRGESLLLPYVFFIEELNRKSKIKLLTMLLLFGVTLSFYYFNGSLI